jgi:hypothetical protein
MTSERTINQVRAILTKLDRSIEEARERRTHRAPAAAVAPQRLPEPQPTPPSPPPMSAPGTGESSASPPRSTSPFGRAQPLHRPQNSPTWRL